MTTNQLTRLKTAGFTLEQIITIGEILTPAPNMEKSLNEPKKSALLTAEQVRKAYEKGRKEAQEEQRRKEMGPMIRGDAEFHRRCEEFRKIQMDGMFLGSMELPRPARGTLGIGIQTP